LEELAPPFLVVVCYQLLPKDGL